MWYCIRKHLGGAWMDILNHIDQVPGTWVNLGWMDHANRKWLLDNQFIWPMQANHYVLVTDKSNGYDGKHGVWVEGQHYNPHTLVKVPNELIWQWQNMFNTGLAQIVQFSAAHKHFSDKPHTWTYLHIGKTAADTVVHHSQFHDWPGLIGKHVVDLTTEGHPVKTLKQGDGSHTKVYTSVHPLSTVPPTALTPADEDDDTLPFGII